MGTLETMETKLRREGSGSEGPSVPPAQPGPLPSPCWADGGRRGAAPTGRSAGPGPGTEGRGLSVAILTFGLLVLFRGLEERGLLLLGQEPKPGQGGGRLAMRRGSSGVWVLASACRPRGAWGTRGPRRRVPTSPLRLLYLKGDNSVASDGAEARMGPPRPGRAICPLLPFF